MADAIKAGAPTGNMGGENKFPPHPAGPVMMLITDVVDLGEALVSYKNEPPYIVQKCAIIHCSGQRNPSGALWEVAREFTVSTGAKSKLRPYLEAIKGEPLKGKYPEVRLEKLVGWPVYCVISHAKSDTTGYTYANITSIAPLPPGTKRPVVDGYVRLDRWEKKKAQYAAEVAAYKAEIGAPAEPGNNWEEPLPPEPEPEFLDGGELDTPF